MLARTGRYLLMRCQHYVHVRICIHSSSVFTDNTPRTAQLGTTPMSFSTWMARHLPVSPRNDLYSEGKAKQLQTLHRLRSISRTWCHVREASLSRPCCVLTCDILGMIKPQWGKRGTPGAGGGQGSRREISGERGIAHILTVWLVRQCSACVKTQCCILNGKKSLW